MPVYVMALRENQLDEVRSWAKNVPGTNRPLWETEAWPTILKCSLGTQKIKEEDKENVATAICAAAVSEVRSLFPKQFRHVELSSILSSLIQGFESFGYMANAWLNDKVIHTSAAMKPVDSITMSVN